MPDLAALDIIRDQVLGAQDGHAQIGTFSSSVRQPSMREAYEVSWRVHEDRLRSGWRPIGRKIGFTNPDMWALFGVTQPVWAFVYDRTHEAVDTVARCDLATLCQPRIEPEIVLCLRTVPAIGADEREILACVDWIAHGIEMVQCHYPAWKFKATDAVCDASFHGRLLVGNKRFVPADPAGIEALLKECEVGLYCNDALVEVGHGRNVLGSPLAAIAALMEAIRREGSRYPIVPGEIITTGTMTRAYPVSAGERWHTTFARREFPGLTIDFV